jgi:transposase
VSHPFHWKKVSVAGALGYRWDGRRCRLYFQTKPDSYNTAAVIRFLRALQKHFRGRRVILLWDRLNAHRSRAMQSYLAGQRDWLTIEWLPTYAPELNPVEFLWGNVKGKELANLEVEDTFEVVDALRLGLARARRQADLGSAFLRHAGLSL